MEVGTLTLSDLFQDFLLLWNLVVLCCDLINRSAYPIYNGFYAQQALITYLSAFNFTKFTTLMCRPLSPQMPSIEVLLS